MAPEELRRCRLRSPGKPGCCETGVPTVTWRARKLLLPVGLSGVETLLLLRLPRFFFCFCCCSGTYSLFLPLPPPSSSILPPPPSPLLLLPLRAFYVACRLVVLFFFRCDCGSSASPAVGALDVPVLASAAAAFFVAASVKWYGLPPCRASESIGRLSWRASPRNTV